MPKEQMVDELPTIIRIEAEHGHGKQRADSGNRPADRPFTPIGECDAFRPLGGDVGEHERVHAAQRAPVAARALPAMPDEVDFEETGPVVLPVGVGADRDLMLQERTGLGRRPPARRGGTTGGGE